MAPRVSPGARQRRPPTHVALRPRLPMVPGWIRDGSVRFPWSLSTTIKSHFALRPRLPPAPGWLWDDSVRFALSLSTTQKSHFAFAHSFHLFRGGSVMAPRVSPRARQWHPNTCCASPTASDGSGVVLGWLRAFRMELAKDDKITLRASSTASACSGMVPEWLRALRLELVNGAPNACCAPPVASDASRPRHPPAPGGSGVAARAPPALIAHQWRCHHARACPWHCRRSRGAETLRA